MNYFHSFTSINIKCCDVIEDLALKLEKNVGLCKY